MFALNKLDKSIAVHVLNGLYPQFGRYLMASIQWICKLKVAEKLSYNLVIFSSRTSCCFARSCKLFHSSHCRSLKLIPPSWYFRAHISVTATSPAFMPGRIDNKLALRSSKVKKIVVNNFDNFCFLGMRLSH